MLSIRRYENESIDAEQMNSLTEEVDRLTKLVGEIRDLLPSVWADADMVNQIVYNLVLNAIQYTPNDGPISIAATAENDMV